VWRVVPFARTLICIAGTLGRTATVITGPAGWRPQNNEMHLTSAARAMDARR
jgi:hypothetical protein